MILTAGKPAPNPNWGDADQDAKLAAMARNAKALADEEAAELHRVCQRIETLGALLDERQGHPKWNEKAATYDLLCARRFHLVLFLWDRQHRLEDILWRMSPPAREDLGIVPGDVWPTERIVPAWVRRAAERRAGRR
jgi:hypothetical protein